MLSSLPVSLRPWYCFRCMLFGRVTRGISFYAGSDRAGYLESIYVYVIVPGTIVVSFLLFLFSLFFSEHFEPTPISYLPSHVCLLARTSSPKGVDIVHCEYMALAQNTSVLRRYPSLTRSKSASQVL